jgi:hypothetical protein
MPHLLNLLTNKERTEAVFMDIYMPILNKKFDKFSLRFMESKN